MLSDLVLKPNTRTRLAQAAAAYEGQLDDAARAYLHARKLDGAAGSFRLGVVREPLPGDEAFTGRLAIPYLTPAGVVAMKYRSIDDGDGPKYTQAVGQQQRLFNAQVLADPLERVAIVEGELDAIALQHHCGIPAVAVPGVSMWKQGAHYARCFADVDDILVITDNDVKDDGTNPGQELSKKIASQLKSARVITPPPNLDVNDWINQSGAGTVAAALGVEIPAPF